MAIIGFFSLAIIIGYNLSNEQMTIDGTITTRAYTHTFYLAASL